MPNVNKNFLKYLSFTFAAFSIISGFFQSLAIDQAWIRISIFGLTLVFMLFALFFFLRFQNYDNATALLLKAIQKKALREGYELKHIRSEIELRPVWNISKSIYGEEMVDFSSVRSWLKHYPNGIYALFFDHEISGFFSIWPIKKKSFQEIIDGKKREQEITYQNLESNKGGKSLNYWYVANIVVNTKYRKTIHTKHLIKEAITQWLSENKMVNGEINFCALAYSKEGELLLKRFGFQRYLDKEKTRDKYPIYVSTKTVGELQSMVEKLK